MLEKLRGQNGAPQEKSGRKRSVQIRPEEEEWWDKKERKAASGALPKKQFVKQKEKKHRQDLRPDADDLKQKTRTGRYQQKLKCALRAIDPCTNKGKRKECKNRDNEEPVSVFPERPEHPVEKPFVVYPLVPPHGIAPRIESRGRAVGREADLAGTQMPPEVGIDHVKCFVCKEKNKTKKDDPFEGKQKSVRHPTNCMLLTLINQCLSTKSGLHEVAP